MQTYAFTVQTDSTPEPSIVDVVYGACDDATASAESGRLVVAFDRESDSLERAIRSAVDTLRSLNLSIISVTLDVESLTVLN